MRNCLCLTLLGVLSLGWGLSGEVQAESSMSNASASKLKLTDAVVMSNSDLFVIFEPPTDEKVDNSRGGASRPADVKCIHDDAYGLPLTALIPQSGVGLTVVPHPTLLVYVPPTMATQAHLTLRDAEQVGVYQTQVQIPKTGGILSIALPTDSPELLIDETYHWSMVLLCQPTQTDMPIVSGQIRRVALSNDTALAPQQPLLLQAVTYGQIGVWHDMLTSLATLRQSQPDNRALIVNWIELLQAEDLGAIANSPLLN